MANPSFGLRSALPINNLLMDDPGLAYSQATASEFEKGWNTAGAGGTAASYDTRALEAEASGDLASAQAYMDEAARVRQEAAGWSPRVSRLEDIHNLSDAGAWAGQGFGNFISSAPSAIGGAVGGIASGLAKGRLPVEAAANLAGWSPAGRFTKLGLGGLRLLANHPAVAAGVGSYIPSFLMEKEEAASQALNDPEIRSQRSAQEILDAANAKAAITATGEALIPGLVGGKLAGSGLRKAITPTQIPGTVLKGTATGVGGEFLTEGTQGLVGQAAQNYLRGDALDNFDYMDALNEAAVGGLIGGGMGTVGGVADAAYGSVGAAGDLAAKAYGSKPVQAGIDKIKEVAPPLISRGVDKAVELGGKAKQAAKDFVEGGRETFKAGMSEAGQQFSDTADVFKATGDPALAERGAGNAINSAVKTLKDSVLDGIVEATGLGKEEAEKKVDSIGQNPYSTPGYNELGFKSDKERDDHYSKYVGENSSVAGKLAHLLKDDNRVPERERAIIKAVLDSGSLIKGSAVDKEKAQAQIATIYRAATKREDFGRDVSSLFDDFVYAQEVEGKPVPTKFSKQSTDPAAAERGDNVRQVLSDLNIDKQTITKLVKLAERGDAVMFDMAVTRELMATGKLGSLDDGTAEVYANQLRSMIKQDDEFTAPPQNRATRRKALRDKAAAKEASAAKRNLSFLPSMVDKMVAEKMAGSDLDNAVNRRMMSSALQAMLSGFIDGTTTHEQVARTISNAYKYLGEKGAEMIDGVAELARWHAERSSNAKMAARIEALQSKVSTKAAGNTSPIALLDSAIGLKGTAAERREKAHSLMGELISAYMKAQSGTGVLGDAKKQIASLRSQVAKLRKDGREDDAAAADYEAYRLEKSIDGATPETEFKDAVKKITGKDVAGKVAPIIKKRIAEIQSALSGPSVPSKLKAGSAKAPYETDVDNNLDDYEARQAQAERAAAGDEDAVEMEVGAANESGTQGGTEFKDYKHFGDSNNAPLSGEALQRLYDDISERNQGARVQIQRVVDWAEEKAAREGVDADTLLDEAAAARNTSDLEQLPKLRKQLDMLERERVSQLMRNREGSAVPKRKNGSLASMSEAELKKEIGQTENRIDRYSQVRGDGRAFFNTAAAWSTRYITVSPATGEMAEVDTRLLNRYLVDTVAKPDGTRSLKTRINSVLRLKDSTGKEIRVDIAKMLFDMMDRAGRNEHLGDLSGAGEKTMPNGLLTDVRQSFTQLLASMMMSDALSDNDAFFESEGTQASRKSRDEFSFNPSMVIYRDGKNGIAITYGQAFGLNGETAASAKTKKATDDPLSKNELESVLPQLQDFGKSKRKEEATLATLAFVTGTRVVAGPDGSSHFFSPRALIKAMMYRHGMRADEILTDNTDGISKAMAAALLKEGLALLEAQGYSLQVGFSDFGIANVPLWNTYYGDNKAVPVTFGDVASKIPTKYTGSFDYRSDKIEAAREGVESAQIRFNKASAKLAQANLRPDENDALSAEKQEAERTLNTMLRKMAEEQRVIVKKKVSGSGIERIGVSEPHLENDVQTEGVVDIYEGMKAEQRRNVDGSGQRATQHDLNESIRGGTTKRVSSPNGVRGVTSRATAGITAEDNSRRDMPFEVDEAQAAADKAYAKNMESPTESDKAQKERDKQVEAYLQPFVDALKKAKGVPAINKAKRELAEAQKEATRLSGKESTNQPAIEKVSTTGYEVRSDLPDTANMYSKDVRTVNPMQTRRDIAAADAKAAIDKEDAANTTEMLKQAMSDAKTAGSSRVSKNSAVETPSVEKIINTIVDSSMKDGLAYVRSIKSGPLPSKVDLGNLLISRFGSLENWPTAAKQLYNQMPADPSGRELSAASLLKPVSIENILKSILDMKPSVAVEYAKGLIADNTLPNSEKLLDSLRRQFGEHGEYSPAAKLIIEHLTDGPNDDGPKGGQKFSKQSTLASVGGVEGNRGITVPKEKLTTVSAALDYVIANEKDANLKAMAKAVRIALAASRNQPKIRIFEDGKLMQLQELKRNGADNKFLADVEKNMKADDPYSPVALYSPVLNEIHILNGQESAYTIVHEAAHAATLTTIHRYITTDHLLTIRTLDDLQPIIDRMVGIHGKDSVFIVHPLSLLVAAMIEARTYFANMALKKTRMLTANTKSLHYGLSNLHEFIAEFFSNQRFRNMLEQIELSKDDLDSGDYAYIRDGLRVAHKNWLRVVYEAISKLINSTLSSSKITAAKVTGEALAELFAHTSVSAREFVTSGKTISEGALAITRNYSYNRHLAAAFEEKKQRQNNTPQKLKFSKQDTSHEAGNDARAIDDFNRRLGDLADILIQGKAGEASGTFTSKRDTKTGKALATVNPHAPNIQGASGHESWHAVKELLLEMGDKGKRIVETIERAAMRPEVQAWIRQRLLDAGENPASPNGAFSQLSDPEESAAFAFQFFVETQGKMPIPISSRGIFNRVIDFLKKLAGMTDDIYKTGRFFQFFDTGEFLKNHKNPQSVLESLRETKREKIAQELAKAIKPLREAAFAAFGHAADRIKAMNIPAYTEILNRFQNGEEGYAGYAEEQRARFMEFGNEYASIVNGYDPNKLPEAQQKKLEELITRFEQYRKDSGDQTFDLGRKNIPASFDAEKISGHLEEFKQDLLNYGGLKLSKGSIEDAVNQILIDGHYRYEGRGRMEPFRDHPEKMDKWKSDNATQSAFSYFKQGTRSAEIARAFPEGKMGALLDEGDASANAEQKKMIRSLINAYTGRAGYDMNTNLRKLFGATISFINMALLPFAVFSQMLEPLQLAFRKNSMEGVLRNMWRGLRDMPRSFQSVNANTTPDYWENTAKQLGLVTDAAAVSIMADLMSDIPLTGKLQKANQLFFRYNFMEQWSRSMHVAATQNGAEFIKHHDKHPSALGDRLLGELGLKRGSIKYDGEQIDFSDKAARKAILQFVNESMAHPDPGTNTMWMNDPRFALFAHLKRFTFGFSYYIHGRAMNEIKENNWKALLPLAYAVPWMIAADSVKDFIKPGEEAYKNNWGVSDYALHGMDRAGIPGRYGIAGDMGKNLGFGGSGIEGFAPTTEMVAKVIRAADRGDVSGMAQVLPGHQILG